MTNKKATVPILSVGADREQPKQLCKISITDNAQKYNRRPLTFTYLPVAMEQRRMYSGG